MTLQDNGGDTLSLTAGTTHFAFATALPSGATYDVRIATQPSQQLCDVENGTGAVGAADVTAIVVVCGLWAWESGEQIQGDLLTSPPPTDEPVARWYAMSWTDSGGNLWLFGGAQNTTTPGPEFSDLWVYSPTSGQWTRKGGAGVTNTPGTYGTQGTAAAANMPGARAQAMTWVDFSGNLWLFGGYGFDAAGSEDLLNDIWKYDIKTGEWTWVGGSDTVDAAGVYGTMGIATAGNVPSARHSAATWIDSSGNFWLFGGVACCTLVNNLEQYYDLNDLWMFSPATGMWTWEGGSSTPNAAGMFGTQGAAAPANVPSARDSAQAWVDGTGKFWLFGGEQFGYYKLTTLSSVWLNDLWRFDPSTGLWTWINGPQSSNGAGVWGLKGIAAPANIPSARAMAATWTDKIGDLWLIGGDGLVSGGEGGTPLNDVWKFDPVTGDWTWLGGTASGTGNGIYGTVGVPAAPNIPGGRYGAAFWSDPAGGAWIFGGYGASAIWNPPGAPPNSYTVGCCLNDLWRYHP